MDGAEVARQRHAVERAVVERRRGAAAAAAASASGGRRRRAEERGADVVQLGLAADHVRPGRAPPTAVPGAAHDLDERAVGPVGALGRVVLVVDLPDDLLEDIFQRHDARGAAVLVHHDGEVPPPPPEALERGPDLCVNQPVSRVHPIILHYVISRRERGRVG